MHNLKSLGTNFTIFPVKNRKIAVLRAAMVVTHYSTNFRTWADRHSGILMFLLLLVTGAIKIATRS